MKHEKQLLALPLPPCPALPGGVETRDGRRTETVRYAAALHTVGKDEILSVVTYDDAGRPKHRFFQSRGQWGAEVFQAEEGDWQKHRRPGRIYEAGIDTFYDAGSYHRRTQFSGKAASGRCILSFLGEADAPLEEAVPRLMARQREERRRRREAKQAQERAAIRADFGGLSNEPPEGFLQWVEDVPLRDQRYFFYTYTGHKTQEGVCSCCGEASRLAGIREGQRGECPRCGSGVTYYSARRFDRGHGFRHEVTAASIEPMADGRRAVRIFQVVLRLTPDRHGGFRKKLFHMEQYRRFLDGGTGAGLTAYENVEKTTRAVKVDGLGRSDRGRFGPCPLYPAGVEAFRRALGLYVPVEELSRRGLAVDAVTVWQADADCQRTAEVLIRQGLYRLAAAALEGVFFLRRDGGGAAVALGVPGDALEALRRTDPGPDAFWCIRRLLAAGVKVREQDMRDLSAIGAREAHGEPLEKMMKRAGCTLHKALAYFRRQAGRREETDALWHGLQRWQDYINMTIELGKDIRDGAVAMPKDLRRAHDEALRLLRVQRDKKTKQGMRRQAKALQDLRHTAGGLCIRPAATIEELIAEGDALHHCVGRAGYAKKMAEGRTAIFFIRRAKEPERPYVTLEVSLTKWEKIQCYGDRDTWPGKAVDAFVERWIEKIVKPARLGRGEGETA